jgi:uncharacterized protein (DUF1800 family)
MTMGALSLKGLTSDVGRRAAFHALSRLAYGPKPGDVDSVLDQGIEPWILEQVHPPTSDPEAEGRLRGFPSIAYSTPQILALYNADNRVIGTIINDFYSAKLIRSVHAQNQLLEVMVDFWFNHFNVNINDGFVRYSIMSYERDAIRPHALGKFRALLGAVAAHPAMLFYLDNYLSTVSRVQNGRLIQGLNENYGRELLELHTVGVDAGYTQPHVFDAARCFTGWGIDNQGTSGQFIYRSQNHDTAAKSVFGLNLPAGGQRDDGEKLLDYLALHPATAHFVSKKLAQRFVADDPPQSLVDKMAATWVSSGGDIPEVLLRMFGSTEFWAEEFLEGPGKPKTPIEFLVSGVRAVQGQVTNGVAGLSGYLANMGWPLYQCLPPTGYSFRGSDWLNASSQLYRMNFALDLSANRIGGVTVDTRALARGLTAPSAIAGALAHDVFAGTLSRQTQDAAARVDTRTTNPTVASRVTGLLLASPEFQVR